VVVLENRIYVYNFADLRLIDAIDTCNNPRGLCALNPDSNYAVLATPDREQGQVRITIFEKKVNQVIQAHQNALYALALTAQGHLLATASEKGTLIRIFSTTDRTCLQETRRGSDRAEITCLQFDKTSKWLAVSSDKQTIHLFVVSIDKEHVLQEEN
jgi:WD repeat-containing protein 45